MPHIQAIGFYMIHQEIPLGELIGVIDITFSLSGKFKLLAGTSDGVATVNGNLRGVARISGLSEGWDQVFIRNSKIE